jgi:hypothetical protein
MTWVMTREPSRSTAAERTTGFYTGSEPMPES